MARWVLAGTAAWALAASAFAAPRPAVITQPDWLERPKAEDLEQAYPPLALVLQLEGFAAISCRVDSFGRLDACEARTESPPGLGFGPAAVSLAPSFQMKPLTINGAPTDGGEITIPITFRWPPRPAAPAPAPVAPATLALALRLVDGGGMVEPLQRALAQAADQLEYVDAGELAPEMSGDAAAALRSAVAARAGELRIAMATDGAAIFTPAELEVMARAYDGPGGAVMRRSADRDAVLDMVRRDASRKFRTRAHEAFCGLHDCSPAALAAKPVEATIVAPAFAEAPSQADIDAARPTLAEALAVQGGATLRCRVTARATLEACEVLAETPAGLGFGASALSLAPKFRVAPTLMAQGAQGETLALAILFRPDDLPAAFEPPAPRSARTLALARELVALHRAGGLAGIERSYAETRRLPLNGADARLYAETVTMLETASRSEFETIQDGSARTYAALYTEAELAAALAYLRTPESRSVDAKIANLTHMRSPAVEEVVEHIIADARAAFCKQHSCEVRRPAPATELKSER